MPIRPKPPARDSAGQVVDWVAAKAAFVACKLSTRAFAKAHGLAAGAVRSRCTREQWIEERRRIHPGGEIDWPAMEQEFVAGGETIGEFALARGLPPGAVRGRAQRGDWVRKRALSRAGHTDPNWVQLRAEYAACHADLRAFCRRFTLKYSTAYRHYRQERWELARLNHWHRVARRIGMKVGKLQARTEDELDFVADDHCVRFIDGIDRLEPDMSRMQDAKSGIEAFIIAHRYLRVTHGLPPDKEFSGSTFGINAIFSPNLDGTLKQVYLNGAANADEAARHHSGKPSTDADPAEVPGDRGALPPAGGGSAQR